MPRHGLYYIDTDIVTTALFAAVKPVQRREVDKTPECFFSNADMQNKIRRGRSDVDPMHIGRRIAGACGCAWRRDAIDFRKFSLG
jgi:hypothetical protein